MAITHLTKAAFTDILGRELSSSHPIKSADHLRGRERQLQAIEQALYTPGRQVFVYGDRGVGKTSLAWTAARQYEDGRIAPIYVLCQESSTFGAIVRSVVEQILDNPTNEQRVTSWKAGLNFKLLGGERSQQTGTGKVEEVSDINSALNLLDYVAKHFDQKALVIVDEFDRIGSKAERTRFAELVKGIADRGIGVRLLFCGIGRSVTELLEEHASSHRYLENVLVERLIYGPREEIIKRSAGALGVAVDSDTTFRIAAVSDGFPHYVHLICEKLYWAMFNGPAAVKETTPAHYIRGISDAVRGIEQKLKNDYSKATMRNRGDLYEEALWAMADHQDLQRHRTDIFHSHCRVREMRNRLQFDPKDFFPLLDKLKSPSFGPMLVTPNRFYCEFAENIMRGYVRLRAEEAGVRLKYDHEPSRDPPRVAVGGVKLRPSPLWERPRPFKEPRGR